MAFPPVVIFYSLFRVGSRLLGTVFDAILRSEGEDKRAFVLAGFRSQQPVAAGLLDWLTGQRYTDITDLTADLAGAVAATKAFAAGRGIVTRAAVTGLTQTVVRSLAPLALVAGYAIGVTQLDPTAIAQTLARSFEVQQRGKELGKVGAQFAGTLSHAVQNPSLDNADKAFDSFTDMLGATAHYLQGFLTEQQVQVVKEAKPSEIVDLGRRARGRTMEEFRRSLGQVAEVAEDLLTGIETGTKELGLLPFRPPFQGTTERGAITRTFTEALKGSTTASFRFAGDLQALANLILLRR